MRCSLAARFILPTAHGRWSLGRGRRGGEARWKLKIILLWHLINKCKCEARTGLEPLTKLPIKPWEDGLAPRPPSPKLYRLSVFPLNVRSASSRHLFVCAHTDLCAFVRISIPKAAGCALISPLRTLRKRKQTTATEKKKKKKCNLFFACETSCSYLIGFKKNLAASEAADSCLLSACFVHSGAWPLNEAPFPLLHHPAERAWIQHFRPLAFPLVLPKDAADIECCCRC